MSPLRSPMVLALLLALSCSSPPTLTSVRPAEVLAGHKVVFLGEGFGEGTAVRIAKDGESIELGSVTLQGVVSIEAVVPDSVAAGTYDVTVDVGGRTTTLPGALVVVEPEREQPCGGDYTSQTEISVARREAAIDRFYKDGRRETLRIPIAEIEQVEYELVRIDGGELCSAVYLRKTDGRRVLFDSDTKLDLKQRAYKVGRYVKKKIEITRMDAEEMGKPMETR